MQKLIVMNGPKEGRKKRIDRKVNRVGAKMSPLIHAVHKHMIWGGGGLVSFIFLLFAYVFVSNGP